MNLGILVFVAPDTGKLVHADAPILMTQEESERYATARILIAQMEGSDKTAPPLYWMPLSSAQPIEASAATTLNQEELLEASKKCTDPNCSAHGPRSLGSTLSQMGMGQVGGEKQDD